VENCRQGTVAWLSRALLACLIALAAAGSAASAAGPQLPLLPTGWPSSRLELGLADQPGRASALRKSVPLRFRYQYLAGGANTGEGWATWNENATFVTRYVRESRAAGLVPVFSLGYVQQRARRDDAATVPHARAFAERVVRLCERGRDRVPVRRRRNRNDVSL
jgi:hypothetical protein